MLCVGDPQVSGHAHYETSYGNRYCDARSMSIPHYDRQEARLRLELVHDKQGDEDDLMLAASGELGEVYKEDGWETEEFEDEEEF